MLRMESMYQFQHYGQGYGYVNYLYNLQSDMIKVYCYAL